MTSVITPLRRAPGWLARSVAGLSAVSVKELRGRMRGRRAFAILTLYLVLMAAFAWMSLGILESTVPARAGGFVVSSQIGQQLFLAILFLETLLVPFLAPALTAPAISLEREKQTLDMLTTTPISSLGLVLGKLFSALTYVFLLILASIPLTALVFVFGGVTPDDVVRGYVVLFVTAVGFGSIGLFFSALIQRTQAATVATYVVVLAMTIGALFVWMFWRATGPVSTVEFQGEEGGMFAIPARPPEALLYFNPFASQADVICGTEPGYGSFCQFTWDVTGRSSGPFVTPVTPEPAPEPLPAPAVGFGIVGQDRAILSRDPVEANADLTDVVIPPVVLDVGHDTFWPRAMAAWIALSVVLIGMAARLVGPSPRPLLRLPRRKREEVAS